MSTDGSSNRSTQGATPRIGDVLLGGMVFFKVRMGALHSTKWLMHDGMTDQRPAQVEETIFEVARYRFTEYSEIFADMFRLPQVVDGNGTADVEGRDKEHPIFLDAYKAVDFAALIKVLYPA